MSSEDLSSDIDDEEEDEDSQIDDDEDERDEENTKDGDDKVQDDDDEFESITGFGTKVINKPHREMRPPSFTQKPAPGAEAPTTDTTDPGGEEEDEVIKELFVNTFVENGPDGLGIMDALQIAVVFEEMSDQLDIIGKSIDAPEIDLRSKDSMEHDLTIHRPVVTIPATLDPYSNSFFKEKYILRQHYHTVAARRIEQMCSRTPGANLRRRLTAVLRDFGVNRFSEKGKVQSERTQMNIILDNVASELIQDLTFRSLLGAIDHEKEKYEGMKFKVQKSIKDKDYIIESKELLKRMRIEKKKARKDMQIKLWEFEDNRQELLKRKELEFLYVNHNATMTKDRMRKMCGKVEKAKKDVLENMKMKREKYEYAHYLMLDVIYKKYKEAQRRLEYWVEKYEVDKETLQGQLDQMKADRARDLLRIEWLKAMIKDYEQIVMDDRRIKKIVDDKVKLEKLNNKKATKIQAWWRGEMYRKSLGPYRKDKKGKGKDKK